MGFESLPDAWEVWNEEPDGRAILAYRPDVFEGRSFPAPCMPTIHVSDGSRAQRPGASRLSTDTWHAVLYLEPEIEGPVASKESRPAAVEAAVDIADRFAGGEVDYRDLYQVPREAYLDRLDELTG